MATMPLQEACNVPGLNFNLITENGFHLIEPASQIWDDSKETVVIVMGIHPNEVSPCLLDQPDEDTTINPDNAHLQAIDQLFRENQDLPFNVRVIADPLRGINFNGHRQIPMERFEVGKLDSNRVFRDELMARVSAKLSGQTHPPIAPLPLIDNPVGLDYFEEELLRRQEADYRSVENRMQSLIALIRQKHERAITVIAHTDKEIHLPFAQKDSNSYNYTYFHTRMLELEKLKMLNAGYVHSLRSHPGFNGQLRIASNDYVVDQNPPFDLKERVNETADGAIFLTDMIYDGSIENALAILGQPIVLSHELQDDLPPEFQTEIVKLFFLELLQPLSLMLNETVPREI